MELKHDWCYDIIQTKDKRYDGSFYTAVKSTGIYCRPICKVPAPKSENCEFFLTAEACEDAGYRPCMRCRPELAPKFSEFEQRETLFHQIMIFFEKENYKSALVKDAELEFGITSRHIHRLFKEAIGVSPMQYILTKRLHRTKLLLTDTNLKMSEIAELSGFQSISQFNAAFKKHYKIAPSQMRKKQKSTEDGFVVFLSYKPPYDVKSMLDFFRKRIIEGVEYFCGDVYYRVIAIQKDNTYHRGWISVSFIEEKNQVKLTIDDQLKTVFFEVIERVKRVFDLNHNPSVLPEGIHNGVRLPGAFSLFEIGVRGIIGQQITVRAAQTIGGRLNVLGAEVMTPIEGLNKAFIEPEKILEMTDYKRILGELGVINSRAEAIYNLAKRIVNRELKDDGTMNVHEIAHVLLSIKGIGPWTCDYILMRGLNWPDIFLISDIGVKHGLEALNVMTTLNNESKTEIKKHYTKEGLEYAERFRPYRSYLNIQLWQE